MSLKPKPMKSNVTKPVLPTPEKHVQINAVDTAINANKPMSENTSMTMTSTDSPPADVQMDGMAEYYRSLLLKEFDDILVDFRTSYHHCARLTIEFRLNQRQLE